MQGPLHSAETLRLFSARGVTWLGLIGNVLLAAIKAIVGLAAGSQALLADAVHSLSDMVSDLAVLAGLRASAKPADQDHHYGHRRVQTLVAMFIGLLILAAAAGIGYNAARSWLRGVFASYGWLPFAIAMLSVVTKEALYQVTRMVARKTKDAALKANAWHHRSDAISSVAAGIGMFGVALGGSKWAFLDHATALALAGFLIAIGLRIAAEAGQELIDRAPARDLTDRIAEIICSTEGVRDYHAFRMRQLGGKLEMDVHIQVEPTLTVCQGHDIATEVRRRIMEVDSDVTACIVHVEPYDPTG